MSHLSPILFSDSDLLALGALPPAIRSEVESWLKSLARVTPPLTHALATVARQMGVSYQTARDKYYALRKSRDWRVLVNRAKCPDQKRGPSPEFIEWFKALCESNQRKSRPAHRAFAKLWRAGESIPGLDNSLPRHELPAGTGYHNLQKLYKSTRLELTAMRIGLAKAAPYLPRTFTTRVGLWPASHYMFDDLRHDNFIVFNNRPVRVDELDCLEVLSADKVAWGTKPRFLRDDGSEDALKEKYMRLLLAKVLFRSGFSPRGTELMAEHGTAAISERIEQLLFDRTGGLVRVRRSGITGEEQAVAGMARGRGLGNFRFKSPLESLRNLIHNELGALPAQTGKDTDNRPERLHGELNYTTDLCKAGELLSPARRDLLRLPLLEYHSQFLPILMDVYRAINNRTWHDLEGWSECGHVTIDYRLSPDTDQWLSAQQFLALPQDTQAMLTSLVRQTPGFSRQRQLSPAEVWAAGAPALRPIPAFVVAEILGPDLAREEPVKGCYFEFQDAELSPSELRFESRVTDPQGRETELPDGSTWLVFVNPFDLDQLFVADAKGAHVGVARRDTRVSRADVESLQRRWGRVAHREAELLAPLRKRHAAMTRDQTALREHNAQVLSAETEAEQETHDRARSALRKSANAF